MKEQSPIPRRCLLHRALASTAILLFAIGLELKDLMFADNESGGDRTLGLEEDERASCAQDVNKCKFVNSDDRTLLNHFFVGLNFTFFLPGTAVISP